MLLALVVAVVAIFGLVMVFVVSQVSAPAPAATVSTADLPQRTLESGEPVLGDPEAPVLILEYSNFLCPACAQYASVTNQIIDTFVRDGRAQIAFMPMVFGFGNDPSFIAAQGALCAIPQDGFWQMHDALFALLRTRGRSAFTLDGMRDTAASLNLDGDVIARCITSTDTATIIDHAIQTAIERGVDATPTLLYSLDGGETVQRFTYADGTPYQGGPPLAVIEQVINQAAQGG